MYPLIGHTAWACTYACVCYRQQINLIFPLHYGSEMKWWSQAWAQVWPGVSVQASCCQSPPEPGPKRLMKRMRAIQLEMANGESDHPGFILAIRGREGREGGQVDGIPGTTQQLQRCSEDGCWWRPQHYMDRNQWRLELDKRQADQYEVAARDTKAWPSQIQRWPRHITI